MEYYSDESLLGDESPYNYSPVNGIALMDEYSPVSEYNEERYLLSFPWEDPSDENFRHWNGRFPGVGDQLDELYWAGQDLYESIDRYGSRTFESGVKKWRYITLFLKQTKNTKND